MFKSIKSRRPKLSKFDLSHEKKLSCNMGHLVPICLNEVVPGDRFRVNSEIMMRLAPMLAPVMHRVDVWVHYFFVPNRIIWNEWEDFITGGPNGQLAPVSPRISTVDLQAAGGMAPRSLADYFGLPLVTGVPARPINLSALPFRAYLEIYNEYYRDQNLSDPVSFSKASGNSAADASVFSTLQSRSWEKDYFTSALPWAQRGDSVSIPVQNMDEARVYASDGSSFTLPDSIGDITSAGGGEFGLRSETGLKTLGLETVEGIDINDLRNSNALQRWLEMAARGGSRYIEQIRYFFGIESSDARLQRPEYLGGGKQNVVISEVLQTSQTQTTPQGNMAGHGVSVGTSNRFRRNFEEHGILLGIMSVLPRTAYQNGINRMWTRSDRFDYYWPQFAHLGEQEIKNYEIYYDHVNEDGALTWGYQSRYAEYKHASSQVSGDFRNQLDYWHMGRKFDSLPPLNEDFVKANPTHRIFANTEPTDDKLWVQVYNKVDALRPMPYYGTPRL